MRIKYLLRYGRVASLIRGNASLFRGMLALALCITVLLIVVACGRDSELYDSNGLEVAEATEEASLADTVTDTEVIVELLTEDDTPRLVVHLCGAVNNPGVYEFDADSRIIDGIASAGGLTDAACADALNLAMPLTDGSRIYVPSVDEMSQDGAGTIVGTGDGTEAFISVPASDGQAGSNGLVNINTADADRLMTLTGIGKSKAEKIIAYRQSNGPFKSIEDIMNVSGIKQAGFDKIKDSITVR